MLLFLNLAGSDMRVPIFTRKQSHLTDRFQMTVMCHKNWNMINIKYRTYLRRINQAEKTPHTENHFPTLQIIL